MDAVARTAAVPGGSRNAANVFLDEGDLGQVFPVGAAPRLVEHACGEIDPDDAVTS